LGFPSVSARDRLIRNEDALESDSGLEMQPTPEVSCDLTIGLSQKPIHQDGEGIKPDMDDDLHVVDHKLLPHIGGLSPALRRQAFGDTAPLSLMPDL
jgi:hypothetical protein